MPIRSSGNGGQFYAMHRQDHSNTTRIFSNGQLPLVSAACLLVNRLQVVFERQGISINHQQVVVKHQPVSVNHQQIVFKRQSVSIHGQLLFVCFQQPLVIHQHLAVAIQLLVGAMLRCKDPPFSGSYSLPQLHFQVPLVKNRNHE